MSAKFITPHPSRLDVTDILVVLTIVMDFFLMYIVLSYLTMGSDDLVLLQLEVEVE